MSGAFSARHGLATLGPELVEVRALLDGHVLGWAAECGAASMLFPPLISTADLAEFDYFENFPHLVLMTSALRAHTAGDPVKQGATVPAERLADSGWGLASAACYNVYLHHRGTRLDGPRYVTTVAQCFRNETEYDGLRRLRGFTMREIVCVGPREAVQEHVAAFKPKVLGFARSLGLGPDIQPAGDPFFAPDGGRALLQRLFPVKEEFVHDGSLAIASVNFHRNFFGERCGITLPDGGSAYSGCVAFGLERWIAALLETHGSAGAALAVVREQTA
ncbi:hypothetical protein GCM10018793_67120 [Streptomyces sulfonofaciens]|uniref:Uncharacterized protein n=1 Tax=Streptomyces sulfonofaciens TaxID=68272 RepID=A0A919GP41_9ACTN|nr:hypothetical protein [Streptomyces sulfonofaciens]GHH88234.1 hypothetical protein GCM10018793_67120 [Streptomyces sulfonofaciens]